MAERVQPYKSGVNDWLFATDPDESSYGDLERDTWDGATGYVALEHLRDVETDKEVLIFHAGTGLGIVGIAGIAGIASIIGIARTTSDPCPAPGRIGEYQVAVGLVPERRLERPVPLAESEDLPEFKEWDLIEDPDLSVAPVTPQLWQRIQELSAAPLVLSEIQQ